MKHCTTLLHLKEGRCKKKTDADLSEKGRCDAMLERHIYTCNEQCLRNTTRFHNGDNSGHTNTPFLLIIQARSKG